MPNFSLIFAGSLQDADDSAVIDWKWERCGDLRFEYRRPDTGERVRAVIDSPASLANHRWNTKVYCGRNWNKRRDARGVIDLLDRGLFKLGSPDLPPPRPRTARDDSLTDIRRTLARLERR